LILKILPLPVQYGRKILRCAAPCVCLIWPFYKYYRCAAPHSFPIKIRCSKNEATQPTPAPPLPQTTINITSFVCTRTKVQRTAHIYSSNQQRKTGAAHRNIIKRKTFLYRTTHPVDITNSAFASTKWKKYHGALHLIHFQSK
jgi:hypothetical protein